MSGVLADKCVAGIVADEERCRAYALSSPSLATALNPYIGDEQAAKVVKTALSQGKDLRTVVLEMGLLSEDEVDRCPRRAGHDKGGVVGRKAHWPTGASFRSLGRQAAACQCGHGRR